MASFDDMYKKFYLDTVYPDPVMPETVVTAQAEPEIDQGPEALPMETQVRQQAGQGTSPGEMARGMMDTYAVGFKGAAQGALGLPGDLESIGRAVINYFGGDVSEENKLMTTEDFRNLFNQVAPIKPENVPTMTEQDVKAVESIGEMLAPDVLIAPGVKAGAAAIDIGKSIAKDIRTTPPVGAIRLPNVVSTRLPTAKKASEDPLSGELQADLQTMKQDPNAFSHNVNLVTQYPNFSSAATSPDQQAEDFITQVKDNLLYLYDQVPDATRERSKLWYQGARNIVDRWGQEYKQPDQAISGVLAVLSPQKDWFMNVSLGQRVIDIAMNQRGFQWDSAMDDMAKQIWSDPKYDPVLALVRGKRYEDLADPEEKALWLRTYDQAFNPRDHQIVTPEGDFSGVRMTQKNAPAKVAWGSLNEIGKAISIFDDPSIENINKMLGSQHKVRNFYNNIYAPGDPRGHVTIDTHAVAAGLLRPLSGKSVEVAHNFGSNVKGQVGPKNSSVTGMQGTYGLYAEAYKRAAQERGVLPREMQSITWEAVRGLFPDTFKNAKNAKQIDDIWLRYRQGDISMEEARNAVINAAGGIRPPEWERAGLRGEVAPEGGPAANAGELPRTSVSGGGAGGSGRKQPAAGNSSTVKRASKAPAKGAK